MLNLVNYALSPLFFFRLSFTVSLTPASSNVIYRRSDRHHGEWIQSSKRFTLPSFRSRHVRIRLLCPTRLSHRRYLGLSISYGDGRRSRHERESETHERRDQGRCRYPRTRYFEGRRSSTRSKPRRSISRRIRQESLRWQNFHYAWSRTQVSTNFPRFSLTSLYLRLISFAENM